MAFGTLERVEKEFVHERHLPMQRLVKALKKESWPADIGWDASMLTLLIGTVSAQDRLAIVVFGDGRGGGRPPAEVQGLDVFDLSIYPRTGPTLLVGRYTSITEIVRALLAWRDAITQDC